VTTYLVIGVVGLLLLAASLVLGDVLDGALDALAGDWFSSAVIGGFVSAFGFGAAVAAGVGTSTLITLLVGLLAGLVMGWFAAWLTRLVRGGGSDATLSASDTVGHDATVLTDIPEDGFGLVRVRVGGHLLQLNARAEGALPAGAEVYVTGVLSPTAVTVTPTGSPLT
jgi:membrane protein implicated in regulation of membrane protease activity